ncbi:MAG: helix-turn-helix transcriptional regulator [Gammaproteobacteria bacterium]|nr:helix-turn-helix transcriptional regulator [Gammaproteobacteria bacterium]
MKTEIRSHCPISYTLDLLGDKWSLLILRDILFKSKNSYQDFLDSEERIATNILASRLKKLVEQDFLIKKRNPNNKKQFFYFAAPKAIELIPALTEFIIWGAKFDQHTAVPKDFLLKMETDKLQFVEHTQAQQKSLLNSNDSYSD